mmetsp:Transcript_24260/g.34723  ORF Transcript_24260/g.34723 Transcript_24260/m.34723 type:complete len:247 (+) Transcript_24260:339-1079(+)
MNTSSTKSMSRKTLCRSNIGLVSLRIEKPLNSPKFCKITHRCRSSMCINVFHRLIIRVVGSIRHRQLHASLSTNSRGSNHVIPIRVCCIPNKFRIDLGTTSLGMFQLLKHHNSSTTGNTEPITVLIKGSRCLLGIIIVRSGQGPHAIKHTSKVPIHILPSTTKGNIRLIQQDLFKPRSNTMSTRTARTRDRKTHPLHLERSRQNSTHSRSHGPRHTERPNLILPPSTILHRLNRLDNIRNTRPTLP